MTSLPYLAPFTSKTNKKLLKNIRVGLEREALRVDSQGRLSKKPHPKAFGSPLKNERVTLDFSESQLELTTPPLENENQALSYLLKLERFVSHRIGNELMWAFSMPPKLPKDSAIPLANYGTSVEAQKKDRYRQGLKTRYGGAMQTISGIHFNFSLDPASWAKLAKIYNSNLNAPEFRDVKYFDLMRNVIRHVPMCTYLFGYSPIIDKSYKLNHGGKLKPFDKNSLYGPYATSLRLSEFGYHNTKRSNIHVSYNSINDYLNNLYTAISTPSKTWSALAATNHRVNQLNTNILQLENEFYTSVRPKQKSHIHKNESVICNLACAGVEYVELRTVDLNPTAPTGIRLEHVRFLRVFLTWCLLKPSPKFKDGEQHTLENNQRLVALRGREPGLKITIGGEEKTFTTWAEQLCAELKEVAKTIDAAEHTHHYSSAVQAQIAKFKNPNLTPSAKLLAALKKTNYINYGLELATKNLNELRLAKPDKKFDDKMVALAAKSVEDEKSSRFYDNWILPGYENLELSTQVLIRAAQKRNIEVEVVDPDQNVLILKKNDKTEIIKQASITRRDTYISFELMNHKQLTKTFLDKAHVRVPSGISSKSVKEILSQYKYLAHAALVVKPATTNYGTGVTIVPPHKPSEFNRAVKRAARYDKEILVEEFIAGKEYRFLVIHSAVVAVLNREPANVVGDGTHTITELVALKNKNPLFYKLPGVYEIRLGEVEKHTLKENHLTPDSIPKKNQKVYLRKNSNVSDGGDPIDVTDSVSAAYKKIALDAAAAVGANITGVDMIIKNPKQAPTPNNHAIIEMNWNPAIWMHAYPVKGKPRDVGGAMLNFLGF